jgi:hypothetical protein
MRSLASGKVVAQFSVATNAYFGQGKETAEYQVHGNGLAPGSGASPEVRGRVALKD